MPEMHVDAGEFREIIHDRDAGLEYQYHVLEGTGYLSHSPETAYKGDGMLISRGDRDKLTNLGGDGLFLAAETDVRIHVSGVNFEAERQSRGDEAAVGVISLIEGIGELQSLGSIEGDSLEDSDPFDTSNEPEAFATYQGQMLNLLTHIREGT